MEKEKSSKENLQETFLSSIKVGDITGVRTLLAQGASVFPLSSEEDIPLNAAIVCSNKTMVALLIEAGADPNLRDRGNNCPLHYAAAHGRLEIAQYLIECGAEINAPDDDGRTPLGDASHNGKSNIVDLLLKQKAIEVSHIDKDGRTPLHYAAYWGYIDICKALLEKGGSLKIRSLKGLTPIEEAENEGQLEGVQLLKTIAQRRQLQAINNFKGESLTLE